MFHTVTDASKVALWHLVQQLTRMGFILLDVQYSTPHLKRLGCIEIPKSEYEKRLEKALLISTEWVTDFGESQFKSADK